MSLFSATIFLKFLFPICTCICLNLVLLANELTEVELRMKQKKDRRGYTRKLKDY